MAEHLASLYGTEKDRVNCPFYFKVGACRHGDRCSRLHTKPTISPTLLLSNMYPRPDMITPGVDAQGQPIDPRKLQDHLENFYEDLFEELSKYGEIESLNVCDNLSDHMVGNVYVQFREEEHAARALKNLTGRFYAGQPIFVDFSPVTDFREAMCGVYEENTCNRGGYCNFMHLKRISKDLRRQLFGRYKRRRSRSVSPHRIRGGGGGGGRGGGGGGGGRGGYRSFEERSRGGGRGEGRRFDRGRNYDDYNGENRGRRHREEGDRRERMHRSGERDRERGDREGSEERRAKIEQWNKEREREDADVASKGDGDDIVDVQDGEKNDSREQQPEQSSGYDY
ncbi:hypothetical protein RJ639_038631 [Escallonia herrerae]|uniref:Uncharacterized protein n=1 Tax=Escallonia herrerae TaxID=1293975 RepID=A0AA88WM49_9ASTE|nr:hypothetical protein RJ639_038631 [Escallonia herrerae]